MAQIIATGQVNVPALGADDAYVQIIAPPPYIVGVPTDVVGVVGGASWGPVNVPVHLGSGQDAVQNFGPISAVSLTDPHDLATDLYIAFGQSSSQATLEGFGVRVTDGTDTAASYTLEGAASPAGKSATIAGTVTPGDTLTLTVASASLPANVAVAYEVLTGDTFSSIAAGLATAINANAALQSVGIDALSAGAAVNAYAPAAVTFTLAESTSGGATETITIGTAAATQAGATIAGLFTGILGSLEGINEPNGVGQVSQAVTDTAQTDIWTNGHTLPGISIMGPSLVIGLPKPDGYITGWAAASDIATINANSSIINVHYYPNQLPSLDDGVGRESQINDVFVGEQTAWGTTDPEFITEWHPTYYNSSTTLRFVEAYNGYYAPIFILEAFRLGFIGYFWFSLFDFGSTQCGLIAQNNAVSPTALTLRDGALAIQAMYELAGTASATKHTFTPGKLEYTASGLPAPINTASPNSGGQTMLFQNDAGQFLLYVWNAQVAPGGTAVPVTITFSGNRTKIVEYNITNAGNNQTAVQTLTDVSSITLQLAADVHLLVITY